MKKIVDIDKLFEKFFRSRLLAEKGKYSEEEWLEKLPKLYSEFETTPLKELDGIAPLNYYDDEDDLIGAWLSYVESGVPLNDYLLDAVVNRVDEKEIALLFTEDAKEDVLLSAIEVMRRKNSKSAFNRYIDLLFSKKVCHHVKDEMVEDLSDYADEVAPAILEKLSGKEASSMFAEILSHTTKKDERVKRILLDGLKKGNKVPEYAAYLVNYDDESCLFEMTEYLSRVDDYVSYKELKLAVEALGGNVTDERDFSDDKNYIRIKSAENDSDKK